MKQSLDGKIALVTGSGRGIGREVALKLASEGARLVVNDLDNDVGQDCADTIIQAGGEAVACNGDVTAENFGNRIVKAAVDSYGGIDIIVNNAGYTWDGVIQKHSDEQWYAMLDVHITAPFRVLRAAQPVISAAAKSEKEQGIENFRKVVNVSSMTGTHGNAGQISYAAGKAGIIGVTRSLCKEWGRYKVNVNAVAFGLIRTRLTAVADGDYTISVGGKELRAGVNPDVMQVYERMIPLGRGGTPREAADAIYLFCIPESNYISGQCIIVAGGFEG